MVYPVSSFSEVVLLLYMLHWLCLNFQTHFQFFLLHWDDQTGNQPGQQMTQAAPLV
jgi:hypothetical protein